MTLRMRWQYFENARSIRIQKFWKRKVSEKIIQDVNTTWEGANRLYYIQRAIWTIKNHQESISNLQEWNLQGWKPQKLYDSLL